MPADDQYPLAQPSRPIVPSTSRRDVLLSIEKAVQTDWSHHRVFEVDAGSLPREPLSKYFATFPYPYVNGALHLGHAFTLAKVEYGCNYQRLKGKRVLFPFAFHGTGMPIAASADKIKREMEQYGNPPCFPVEETVQSTQSEQEHQPSLSGQSASSVPVEKTKRKGKAKVAKKSSKRVYQWDILREMGVPEGDIQLFADPYHWLSHFPALAVEDLKAFGLSADWRRSFITTHVNPYYDAFIRWQFNTLRKRDKIDFGARLCVFSPAEDQPCADHDRSEGEGVGITDFTAVKLELLQPYPATITAALSLLIPSSPTVDQTRRVYLPAATLRPETMYGQTNAFVLPDGEYGVFEMGDDTVVVCSARSALNMSYQQLMKERGRVKQLGSIQGHELLGCALRAPLCQYERIYVLPLTTIRMDKGTGVVTSVPSDAPDDWAALQDLKLKPAWRAKFGIRDEHVLPFEVVPVIDIPGLGSQAAADLCRAAQVTSQHDRAKLELIKEKTYKEGFAHGIMIAGDYSGLPVSEAKPKIKADLLAAGLAFAYSEPESRVVSRSGYECVVAYSDQWYIKYGESEWAGVVKQYIESELECYNPVAKREFLSAVNWLRYWACSRSYGLGTALPWDQQYVIESLSDSTIYMAYYTIAHLLQGGVNADNVQGGAVGPSGVTANQLTDEVFDYIFFSNAPLPAATTIPESTLQRLKAEFEFWYPMDLRVSGKDLIGNHLTFSLYTHAAVWEEESNKWPASFFANGHVLIDAQKMSKSQGTFVTLAEAIREYSADATRFALADAGDGLEDANFEKKSANAAILKLTKEITWLEELLADNAHSAPLGDGRWRRGELTFVDRIFLNEINQAVIDADRHYSNMQFRLALKAAFHDLVAQRDAYRAAADSWHEDVIWRYLEVAILLVSPICPHYAQHMWTLAKLDQRLSVLFVACARWPAAKPFDPILAGQMSYLRELNSCIRKTRAELLVKPAVAKHCITAFGDSSTQERLKSVNYRSSLLSRLVVVTAETYPAWQLAVFSQVAAQYELSRPDLPSRASVMAAVTSGLASDRRLLQVASKFAGSLLDELAEKGEQALDSSARFDEKVLCQTHFGTLLRETGIQEENTQVMRVAEAMEHLDVAVREAATKAAPGRPALHLY